MSCAAGEPLEQSSEQNPLRPVACTVNSRLYICSCGQRWWKYDVQRQRWIKVNSNKEWATILEGHI